MANNQTVTAPIIYFFYKHLMEPYEITINDLRIVNQNDNFLLHNVV